jgi:hypothetical protein
MATTQQASTTTKNKKKSGNGASAKANAPKKKAPGRGVPDSELTAEQLELRNKQRAMHFRSVSACLNQLPKQLEAVKKWSWAAFGVSTEMLEEFERDAMKALSERKGAGKGGFRKIVFAPGDEVRIQEKYREGWDGLLGGKVLAGADAGDKVRVQFETPEGEETQRVPRVELELVARATAVSN